MRTSTPRQRPSPLQYVAYCYGYTLPGSMRDWVRNDLAGKGATTRMIIRSTIPAMLLLAPSVVIPMSLYLHASVTLPILIPFVYFAVALNKVWRRHRLAQHGLDPDLVDQRAHERDAHLHRSYLERHGRLL